MGLPAASDIKAEVESAWEKNCRKLMSRIKRRLFTSQYNIWKFGGKEYSFAGCFPRSKYKSCLSGEGAAFT
jgi:hypothetical protein